MAALESREDTCKRAEHMSGAAMSLRPPPQCFLYAAPTLMPPLLTWQTKPLPSCLHAGSESTVLGEDLVAQNMLQDGRLQEAERTCLCGRWP